MPYFTLFCTCTGFTIDETTGKITSLGHAVNATTDVVISASVGSFVKTVTLRFVGTGLNYAAIDADTVEANAVVVGLDSGN